jgi:hypothetical protein
MHITILPFLYHFIVIVISQTTRGHRSKRPHVFSNDIPAENTVELQSNVLHIVHIVPPQLAMEGAAFISTAWVVEQSKQQVYV